MISSRQRRPLHPAGRERRGRLSHPMFGPDLKLPPPTELAKYQEVKLPPLSDEALKIVYVEYDMPGPNRMPWSAFPDKAGQIWIPYYGDANAIARLIPRPARSRSSRRRTRHRRHPLRRAGARRVGVADRAGRQQARPLGPRDPENNRVPGCLSPRQGEHARRRLEAHLARRRQRRRVGDRRAAVALRSQDRPVHADPRSAERLWHYLGQGRHGVVRRVHAAGRDRQDRPRDAQSHQVAGAERQGVPAPHPARQRRHRVVLRIRRRQARPLRSQDRAHHRVRVAGRRALALRARHRSRSPHLVFVGAHGLCRTARSRDRTGDAISPAALGEHDARVLSRRGRQEWFGEPSNNKVGYFYIAE